MAGRFEPLGVPIALIALGAVALWLVPTGYSQRSDALQKLHDWPKAQAKVSQTLAGSDGTTARATVTFTSEDGKKREGFLFDGINRGQGETLTILYDPQRQYPPGFSDDKDVYTESQLSERAGRDSPGVIAIEGIIGAALVCFGFYRIYRVQKAKVGVVTITSLFGRDNRAAQSAQVLGPSEPQLESLAGLPTHEGDARENAVEFLIAAPPQIGDVLSAESTLRTGPQPFDTRTLAGIIAAVLIVAGSIFVCTLAEDHSNDLKTVAIGLALAGAVLFVQWRAIQFKAECSFVAKLGLARGSVKGRRDATPHAQILTFDQACEFRAVRTNVFAYGIYSGSTFDFYWTNPAGALVWRINGTYRRRKELPEGHPLRFANAAESAWSKYYLRAAQEKLKAEGSVPFRLDDRRTLRVGPGFLEFHFGSEPVRLNSQDIASFTLEDGEFFFKASDAKWYSLVGKYRFMYGDISNAKVFLMVLEKLAGCRLEHS